MDNSLSLTPSETQTHVPVMMEEVLSFLKPVPGGVYVDATFGGGGYTRAILEAADCHVWGMDRDPEAIKRGESLAPQYGGRLHLMKSRFSTLEKVLKEENVGPVDGMVFDLGVSSYQLDTAERGFSFRLDGPLDMRMTPEGPTAAQVVNEATEEELADIFYYYGEERRARPLARAIAAHRKEGEITTTLQLATLIRQVIPRSAKGIDPATRAFQALRIYVNQELQEIEEGLASSLPLVKPGGTLVVVSFHSLEDRLVKGFIDKGKGFVSLIKKPLTPTRAEQSQNRRSRSARLRAGVRVALSSPEGGCSWEN
jgi:16S rRNA (cytosine1402-N4)-methyltransferase